MAKRKPQSGGGIPEWVLTYGDLMSLLLCFFILIAAFSEIKHPKEYRKVIDVFQDVIGSQGDVGTTPAEDPTANSVRQDKVELAAPRTAQAKPQQVPTEYPVGPEPKASKVQPGKRFALGGSIMFDPGSHALREDGQKMLRDEIAPRIKGLNYIIEICGHAFGVQDRSELDLQELSYRRARAVRDYLVSECGIRPLTLRVVAVGDTEPNVGRDGGIEEQGQNRRVVVIQTERLTDELNPDPYLTGRPTTRAGN